MSIRTRRLLVAFAASALAWLSVTAAKEAVPVILFVYFVPSNVAFNPKSYDAMQVAATDYATWNRGQFNGTSPNIRSDYVLGDHSWQWYVYNTGTGTMHSDFNVLHLSNAEVVRKLSSDPTTDTNLKHVIFMEQYAPEEDANPVAFEALGTAFMSYQYIQLADTDKAIAPLVIAHEVGHLWGLYHEGEITDCMREGPFIGKCDYSADNRKKVLSSRASSFFANQYGANLGSRSAPPACPTKTRDTCTGVNGVRLCCPPDEYCQPVVTGTSEVYKCTQRPRRCSDQLTDTDYYGNDLKTVTAVSSAACCEECTKIHECKAYTYFLTAQPGIPAGSCYLKTLAGAPTKFLGAVSGINLRNPTTAKVGESCNFVGALRPTCEQGFCDYIQAGVQMCTARPSQCAVQHTEQEYVGYVMAKWNVSTAAECCDACSQTPGCQAYSYYKFTIGLVLDGECHLKSKISVRKPFYGAIAGSQVTPKVCAVKIGDSCAGSNGVRTCCPYDGYCQPLSDGGYQCVKRSPRCAPPLTDRDFYGNDLKSVTATSADDCCNKCLSTVECKAYTHVRGSNGVEGMCYLKKAAGTATSYVGAVAGTIV